MSLSHEPGSADQENPIPEGYTEIPSGSIAVIQSADLGKGKEVSIMTRQGAMPFCTIKRNAPGNRFEPADPDATFTLIFPAGDELLLKIPSVQHRTNSYFIDTQKYSAYFGKSAPFIGDRHIRLDIVSDGSLQIADMGDPHGAIYSVVEKPEPEPYIRYISPEKRILTTEWSQLDLMEADHLSVFYDQESKSAGTLYKLPHRSGYVFRDNSNKSKKTLSPGGTEEFTVTTSAQHTLHIKIEGGKALARADSPIRVETYGVDLFRQTDAGCDGSFGDYINGGRSFYAISFREAGPSKYRFANEDNVGCNIKTGRLVLADGLGANGNGQHASALAVRDIANNPGPFRKAVSDASNALQFLNRELMSPADTVFAVAEFHGDKVNLASTGDARWMLIRNGSIIRRSKLRTFLEDLIRGGFITEREALEKEEYKKRSTMVTTTLLSTETFNPDKDAEYVYDVGLEEGDLLLMVSDGADILTDEQIIECVWGFPPDQAAQRIKDKVASINVDGAYLFSPADGLGEISRHAPWDNVSVCAYKH